MKNGKLIVRTIGTTVKVAIIVGVVLVCCFGIISSNAYTIPKNETPKIVKTPSNMRNLKLLRKWEVKGIHCYVFVMGKDTLIAYSESDIHRQQQ